MKKLLIFATLLLTGCRENLLDTSPYDSVSSATMWTTDNLTDLGVTGVYNALRLNINTSAASGNELYQLDRFSPGGQGRDADALLMGTITTSSALFSDNYRQLFEGVNRANDAIVNIPAKSPSTAEKKARLVAECKFLRAYFYLRLNQLYKGVPLFLEPITPENAQRARSTETEIWNAVIADLTDAINEPNLPAKYAKGNGLYGHITKGAAYALRGKAYLYLQKWAEAAADFSKVKEAGYALFSDYKTLFKLANEQSDEMIFSLQHIAVSGSGSTTQFFCGTRSSFGSCWNTFLVSPTVVDLYENADGSPFNWDAVLPGYSGMTPAQREVFFLRNNLTTNEMTAARNRGADMSQYLPTGNEERILKAYANRDPRLAANVITPYATYLGVFNNANATVTSRWPYRAEAATNGDLRTDTQPYFYYLHRKFVYEGTTETLNRSYGPIDFPLIRYADVLLMWAEALNEQGNTTGAIELVNQVRGRAGVGLLNASAATTVSSQSDLRERIRNERRREFVNEGISFFDEMRWKTWKETVFYSGAGVKQVWGANVQTYAWKGDYLYNWPIPQTEIEMNPALTQNPGWVN
ncbi:RagB/SusD family nutrient uptake outer membrane protein [Siphonobacter curvatus]|uniref:RagB/SusD family nutrient uptake outer membrane protein n=1 Tax=Siphonobacter curvatus TaxID=2094562 RepID=A0A2S7IFI3_9BACT|nr:RagB/SusD family nutrient uptake outer membrane protein [Siphonobacter curvatus]PQA53453.1 RagB/SusD family nutrient uptake outer membrane protein [Siphonobacter curvatus]